MMKRFLKIVRIFFKTLLFLILALVIIFAGFLVWSTLRDYQPAAVQEIEVQKATIQNRVPVGEISLLTWNIGYCGLGKDMDFFYDGGKGVRPGEEAYQTYLNGVFNQLAGFDSIGFIMLQEIDLDAHRSYNTDQTEVMRGALPMHSSAFALNYDVDFVPLPPTNPMMDVESGMMSFSRFHPTTAQRYAFPVNYAWPMKLFMLDRCFILERFALDNGKELVLINTHNSAFSNADLLRLYELWMLRGFMLNEYEKGNYVIAGGDWNQAPWNYDSLRFYSSYFRLPDMSCIEKDFWPQGWSWGVDPHYPTNRNVNEAYRPGLTPTTVLDYFITSPNVEIMQVSVIPTGFEFSDHQPVYMKVTLVQDPVKLCPPEMRELMQVLMDSIASLNSKDDRHRDERDKPEDKPDRFYQRK